jgi:hypothetical protein
MLANLTTTLTLFFYAREALLEKGLPSYIRRGIGFAIPPFSLNSSIEVIGNSINCVLKILCHCMAAVFNVLFHPFRFTMNVYGRHYALPVQRKLQNPLPSLPSPELYP